MISKIISGGQTGADQGSLRAARAFGIPTGGWSPREWMTEFGPAPWLADFGLVECPKPTDKTRDAVEGWLYRSICYAERTKANAQAADVTLWFDHGSRDSKGFACTEKAVRAADRKLIVVQRDCPRFPRDDARYFAGDFSGYFADAVVNVAGNRESKSPGIEAWVTQYLCEVFQALRHERVA